MRREKKQATITQNIRRERRRGGNRRGEGLIRQRTYEVDIYAHLTEQVVTYRNHP